MIDILGKRYYFFALSLLLIVPGLILLAVRGVPLSIDFTGGALLEVSFGSGTLPPEADVVTLYQQMDIEDVSVQRTSENTLVIRSSFLDDAARTQVVEAMQNEFKEDVTILRFDTVGPTVGQEVASRAAMAVGVAAVIVVLYMTFAFRGIPNAFRYGICAIIAMAHDVAVVMSVTAFGALLLGWQIDSLFLTALLTVIGFSVQDKIVVFDRIRENTAIYKRLDFETLVNHSIIQTLQRSINTQLMTVEFMLLALVLFGGVTLREFSLILLIGLFMGTYSSIFVAAPILVAWQNKEWRTWFHRNPSQASA
jgi:preprotein translocase subunit SecF